MARLAEAALQELLPGINQPAIVQNELRRPFLASHLNCMVADVAQGQVGDGDLRSADRQDDATLRSVMPSDLTVTLEGSPLFDRITTPGS
jgi:hypothetical protein